MKVMTVVCELLLELSHELVRKFLHILMLDVTSIAVMDRRKYTEHGEFLAEKRYLMLVSAY